MTEYIKKEDVLKEVVRFSTEEGSNTVCSKLYCNMGLMPTIDIVHCGECYFYPRCREGISLDSNWFCADGERRSDE